ncbi:hypothetical protein [[Mycoplasma] anseris]|uniref:Lipoprotein n=1 Tax=[Mycoplasma] anseris TaxID=92400 RepID=A0A2Z4NDK3_9BACT|nr:hypothetical protein [[Mycoplasma] anseris]AWX69485.1 hypothetical protein DP065_01830 [[Mycoplasma] anseris]
MKKELGFLLMSGLPIVASFSSIACYTTTKPATKEELNAKINSIIEEEWTRFPILPGYKIDGPFVQEDQAIMTKEQFDHQLRSFLEEGIKPNISNINSLSTYWNEKRTSFFKTKLDWNINNLFNHYLVQFQAFQKEKIDNGVLNNGMAEVKRFDSYLSNKEYLDLMNYINNFYLNFISQQIKITKRKEELKSIIFKQHIFLIYNYWNNETNQPLNEPVLLETKKYDLAKKFNVYFNLQWQTYDEMEVYIESKSKEIVDNEINPIFEEVWLKTAKAIGITSNSGFSKWIIDNIKDAESENPEIQNHIKEYNLFLELYNYHLNNNTFEPNHNHAVIYESLKNWIKRSWDVYRLEILKKVN